MNVRLQEEHTRGGCQLSVEYGLNTRLQKDEYNRRVAIIKAALPGSVKEVADKTKLSPVAVTRILAERHGTEVYISDFRIPRMNPVYALGKNKKSKTREDVDMSRVLEIRKTRKSERDRLRRIEPVCNDRDAGYKFNLLYQAFNIGRP